MRPSANSPRPARRSTDGQTILDALSATLKQGLTCGFVVAPPYGIEP
jgi:hypothetical protein